MDNPETHEGEPRNWSKDELVRWLDDDDKWRGVPRAKLVEEVCRRLDEMYQSFVPKYPNVEPVVDLQVLMPWAPWVKENHHRGLRRELGVLSSLSAPQGPLKKSFDASFSAGEFIANRGRSLPMGRHPQDDFRHNQMIIATSVDDGEDCGIVLQDAGQQEAMPMKVLGVWFLPPGGKLYPGYKVACHNLHGHPLQALNGLTGTVVAASAGGKCTVELDSNVDASKGTPNRQEEVPAWALLFRKGTRITQGISGQSRQKVFEDAVADRPWEKWRPAAGDTVVLCGLKARPELNGRFGQVVKEGQASGGGDAESTRHSVKLVKTADPGSEEALLSVKRGNMVAVEPPPPVLVIGYAVQRRSEMGPKLMRFVETQLTLLHPFRAIHCTLREIKCWNRCVDADSRFLAPVPKALKKKLLGQLDPAQWKLGILMPLKRESLDRDMKKTARELKATATCRSCGKQHSKEQKLLWCSRCNGVTYCSVECQRADWRARHKQECSGSTATGAAGTSQAAPAEQAGQADSDANSVLVPVGAPSDMGNMVFHNMRSGKGYTTGAQQLNIHGDKQFLVKIQNPLDPTTRVLAEIDPTDERLFQGAFLLYDKAQSIQFHVNRQMTPEAHKKLARVLIRHGVHGRLTPAARKVYLRARREAANVRIYLDDLPSQQQSW